MAYSRFLEKMIGYEFEIKAYVARINFDDDAVLLNPTTKMGTLIRDHMWLPHENYVSKGSLHPYLKKDVRLKVTCAWNGPHINLLVKEIIYDEPEFTGTVTDLADSGLEPVGG